MPINDTSSEIITNPALRAKAQPTNAAAGNRHEMSHDLPVQPQPSAGFNVGFTGRLFAKYKSPDDKIIGLNKLKNSFSELGGLVIRYHIGQGQRAGLLQQIARTDYAENPVEKSAPGNDQIDLFTVNPDASYTRRTTRNLEHYSHYSLGKSKVLNERCQPLVEINKLQTRGEQALWDSIHSSVWSTGINLSGQLSRQQFQYIAYPENISDDEYRQISAALMKGHFKVNGTHVKITLENGEINTILRDLKTIKMDINLSLVTPTSSQKNGFEITTAGKKAPLGWVVNTKINKVIPLDITENLFRVLRVAQGGFHKLSKEQQVLFQGGLLRNSNGRTQNQAFNAMHVIFDALERDFGFNSAELLPDSAFNATYKRVKDLSEDPNLEITEDFLTGILITEMVQPLQATQKSSPRKALPLRFTNSFQVTQNNAKAIAYACDLRTKSGQPVLKITDEHSPISEDPALPDYRINGQLINPELSNPKHIASVLSAGILVAEQIIIEQLLRDACKYGDNHPNAKALKAILKNNALGNSDVAYAELIKMANQLPKNELGPILGLQFSNCEPIIEKVRSVLGFGHTRSLTEWAQYQVGYGRKELADVATELYNADGKTAAAKISAISKDANVEKELRNLFYIGKSLQQLPGIGAGEQQSRGINAGLILVIQKLAPKLYKELVTNGELNAPIATPAAANAATPELQHRHGAAGSGDVALCPFLSGRMSHKELSSIKGHPVLPTAAKESVNSSSNWSTFFKVAVPVVALAATGFVAKMSMEAGQ